MDEIDINNTKAVRERLIALLLPAPKEEADQDELSRDMADFLKAANLFFRLCWLERAEKTPRNPNVCGLTFPPFSEMLNPSNPASVPSCLRRIVRKHFSIVSNRAADMLMREYDCMFIFSAFFFELDRIVCGDACYKAHSAFLEFAHQYKYYRLHAWYLNPASRLRDWLLVQFHSEDFKKACKAVSEQLYRLEHGEAVPVDATEKHIEASSILNERSFQENILNRRLASKDAKGAGAQKTGHGEVSIPLAAKLCHVQYNTIKNWERRGAPGSAFGYPGLKDLDLLVGFARQYRARMGYPTLEEDFLDPDPKPLAGAKQTPQ